MKIEGAHRVGRLERDEHDPVRARGAAQHDGANLRLTAATIAALEAFTKWNAKLVADLSDEAAIRLQREIERALAPFFPSDDGRRSNGIKPALADAEGERLNAQGR